jgi:hypothetical protein
MKIFYFKRGQKHGFDAVDIADAIRRKSKLVSTYGKNFSGCSWFHYFENNTKVWF